MILFLYFRVPAFSDYSEIISFRLECCLKLEPKRARIFVALPAVEVRVFVAGGNFDVLVRVEIRAKVDPACRVVIFTAVRRNVFEFRRINVPVVADVETGKSNNRFDVVFESVSEGRVHAPSGVRHHFGIAVGKKPVENSLKTAGGKFYVRLQSVNGAGNAF